MTAAGAKGPRVLAVGAGYSMEFESAREAHRCLGVSVQAVRKRIEDGRPTAVGGMAVFFDALPDAGLPTCAECGRPFEKTAPHQICCSPECSAARRRRWFEAYNARRRAEYARRAGA